MPATIELTRSGYAPGVQVFTDADGYEWIEYDMRGYLDMWDDGDTACANGCGATIVSHCYYPVDDMDGAVCPDCVTIL